MHTPHFFGIRHHGPGCAGSLLRAFDSLRPDCVLIEGPPESDSLLSAVVAEGMQPPVALLGYCPEEPHWAVYHPFAEYSPEWQAINWALRNAAPVRFIDLPLTHTLALQKARRETEDALAESLENTTELTAANPEAQDEGPNRDPLQWFAHAAGYADGESWWNHMVEERGDGAQLFAAIAEVMTILRAERSGSYCDADEERQEALREAHMRQQIREAQKAGFERIAVVCGAWHLGALQASVTARSDRTLLQGLPKLKVQATWVPWTYRHLSRRSGYGAGILSPGWYEHLWRTRHSPHKRGIAWLARIARLMRERDIDCSSAHLIEAARLADTLAALRDRSAPGLEELQEATRTVLTMGDDTLLQFIADELIVGDRLGHVPPDTPTVPLQRDIEQMQKTLRLKPEALQRSLDLDLRNANDLARSHMLHRLHLIDIPWGELAHIGRTRGTFHEVWRLQWQPEFLLRIIEASRWGQTLAQAVTAAAIDRVKKSTQLVEISTLLDQVLLADLDAAVQAVTHALETRAALTGDVLQLLKALPPLATIFRYGNVRQTDATMVAHVLDGLIVRSSIGVTLACSNVDTEAAQELRATVLAAHSAIAMRPEQTPIWRLALQQIAAGPSVHELLQGVAVRLLFDDGEWDVDRVAQTMSFKLSSGAEPTDAADWLDGFLNRNAAALLHDDKVWSLVDDWLTGLAEEHFVRVLPLVRRTFSTFSAGERVDLAHRASRGATPIAKPALAVDWDEDRAALPVPLLRRLLGVSA